MKKILSVFLVLTMIVVLVACNANTDKETTSADTTVETTEKAGTTETTVETTTADTTETTTEETTTAEETTTNKDPETQKTSIKILAIGNSFSEDSMEYLYGILQDLGYKEIVLGNMYTGGCSLATHAKNIEHKEKGYYSTYHENTNGKWTHDSNSPTLVKTINKYDWDYVSIQQVSGDSGRPETFEPYLTTVIDYVKEKCPNAEIMWNMTWAYPEGSDYSSFKNYGYDQMTMYNAILSTTKSLILPREEISFVIPTGTAVQNARTSFITESQLHRDNLHLSNDIGRFLAAMMWARQITGMSVANVTYNPAVNKINEQIMTVIKESVENAYNHPFEITESEYTEFNTISTDEILSSYGIDPSKYTKLDYSLTSFAYWNSNTSTELVSAENGSTATNLNQYAATQLFDKTQIPVGSIIVIVDGYVYRPDAFVKVDGQLIKNGKGTDKSGYARQDMVSEDAVVVTEEWWANWSVVGFNLSMANNLALKESVIKSFYKKFAVYVPNDPNEPIPVINKETNDEKLDKLLRDNGFNPSEYSVLKFDVTTYAYYNSTSNSSLVSKAGGSTASNINQFAATKIFTKEELPDGTLIVVLDGYQYRPEGWTTLSSKNSSSSRPGNVKTNGSGIVTVVNDEWWGSWNFRAFNIAQAGNPGLSDAEMNKLADNFYILVPKGTVSNAALAAALKANGYDISDYSLLDLKITYYAYFNSTANSSLVSRATGSTASNINQFAATQIFNKNDLPDGSLIVVFDGYQYRPEGWTSLSSKNSSSTRPANVVTGGSADVKEVNSSWWGSWNYRAFNIAKAGNPGLSDEEMMELSSIFFILVPKGTVKEPTTSGALAKVLQEKGIDASKYTVQNLLITYYAYYNSTSNSYFVSKEAGGTATNLNQFAATQQFTKADLPNGTLLIVLKGYQYRPEGWVTLSTTNTSSTRPANVVASTGASVITVDEKWWGNWTVRAFNIAAAGNPGLSDSEMNELANVFFILIPKQ